jgi:lipopolysaccharide biosynthesis protein
MNARLIAFYLPQFHPVPENDRWWGTGFTEWTNVVRARPLFRNHYQPHVPADLGFYDLRLPESRVAQAELAARYGIEGFCYWHYWFEGRRLLERPFTEVLASGEPKLPFCLAWANETWSRRWLGEERQVLIKQTYSPASDLAHIQWLITAFSDSRYICLGNRPVFLVYRPTDLPDSKRTTDLFRNETVRHGLAEPYLVGIDAFCPGVNCQTFGFDSTLIFAPQLGALPGFRSDGPSIGKLRRNLAMGVLSARLKIYDYAAASAHMLQPGRAFPVHSTVLVGWDNTPRRGTKGVVLIDSSPDRFAVALRETIRSVSHLPFEQRLVFVNAWNEWAEGNHLEPDQRYGTAHLEALTAVLNGG